jgi:hypothetical protein
VGCGWGGVWMGWGHLGEGGSYCHLGALFQPAPDHLRPLLACCSLTDP